MRGHDTVPAAINARIGVKGVDGGKGGIDSGRPSPIVEPGALIQIPFSTKRKSPAGAGLNHRGEGGIARPIPGPRPADSLRSRRSAPGRSVEPRTLIQIPFPTKRKSPAGAGLSRLAESWDESSNQLIETLEQWEEQLTQELPDFDFGGLEP